MLEASENQDLVSTLPTEILVHILATLPLSNVPSLAPVCSAWNNIISSEAYWGPMVRKYLPTMKESYYKEKRKLISSREIFFDYSSKLILISPTSQETFVSDPIYLGLYKHMKNNDFDSFLELFEANYKKIPGFERCRKELAVYSIMVENLQDQSKRFLLEVANLLGNKEFVQKFYDYFSVAPCHSSATGLPYLAAACNQVAYFQSQPSFDYDTRDSSSNYSTLLSHCAALGAHETAKFIRQQKISSQDYISAIETAITSEQVAICRMLIESADISLLSPQRLSETLKLAARSANPTLFNLILQLTDQLKPQHESFYYEALKTAITLQPAYCDPILDRMAAMIRQKTVGSPSQTILLCPEAQKATYLEAGNNKPYKSYRFDAAKNEVFTKFFDGSYCPETPYQNPLAYAAISKQFNEKGFRFLTEVEADFVALHIKTGKYVETSPVTMDIELVKKMLKATLPRSVQNSLNSEITLKKLLKLGANPTIAIHTVSLDRNTRELFTDALISKLKAEGRRQEHKPQRKEEHNSYFFKDRVEPKPEIKQNQDKGRGYRNK
jgi:hypothetical protein